MRYLAIIEYVGTNYAGWQIQKDEVTIQAEVERVLSRILNTPTKVYASGRTDAGVHALGQTFHFDTIKKLDLDKFTYSVNSLLPSDMRVINIVEKREDFHARYSVKSKRYDYLINTGEYNPFERDLVYQFQRKLDLNKIKEALDALVGEHCFKNFTSKLEDDSNYVRKIYEASLTTEGDVIRISFVGNGFMRYMMRMIVGCLIEIGLGKMSVMELKIYLVETHRKIVPYKAPACGLYLMEVTY